MSPFAQRLIEKNPLKIRFGIAALVAAAAAALAASWVYADEPLRTLISIMCGSLIGIAVILAWPRDSFEKKADDMARAGGITERALSWTDVASAIPDPAIVLDRSSAILNYNTAAGTLFDRLRKGLPLEHVNRDPELIAAVTSALENGERQTARLLPRGGLGPRLIATVTPLGGRDHQGAIAALITIRDQSEQHRILEMRTDFIANASHELRTPLASVRGFIETLQGPARSDEAARERFLGIMADQAERMTRLIDDLLLLSRVEEKANLKPTGRVDLNRLVEDVARSLAQAAAERHIAISVDPTEEELATRGDRDELFQVFHNLIENAVKYGRDGGRVVVTLEARKGERSSVPARAIVSIADNGPGIAPEHLPRLTERFYRVSAEHSRSIGGTGLGLAIVKHVINRHQGELSVESVVGYGTTFRVTLPIYT